MAEEKDTKVAEQEEAATPEATEAQEKSTLEVTAAVKAAVTSVMDLSAEERKAFTAEYIGKLTVLELNEQVKALEEAFGVSAAPAGMMMAPVGGGGGGEAEEAEKSSYDVILKEVGPKKIQVIKAVRSLTSLGLKEAKAVVDGAPGPVKEGLAKDEAQKMKEELEQAGATVELK
jgi:large subunit ribosomal protein L7/L12